MKSLCMSVFLVLAIPGAVCFPDSVTLTILHTNDTYGRLLPYSEGDMTLGGVLRRVYLINQIRKENPGNVIVLDAGDAIGPYPLAAFDSGKTVIHINNSWSRFFQTKLGNYDRIIIISNRAFKQV